MAENVIIPNLTWLTDPRGVCLLVVRSELSIERTDPCLDRAGVKNSPPHQLLGNLFDYFQSPGRGQVGQIVPGVWVTMLIGSLLITAT